MSHPSPRRVTQGVGGEKVFFERAAKGELRWCLTAYPSNAMAQEADMGLNDYREFVYAAGILNEDDPVVFWRKEGESQRIIVDWLKGCDQVEMKGASVDIRLSVKERAFIPCDGQLNFPDGEIFTGPVEDSVNGWIRFKYPSIEYGQEVTDIELWFENGKVVKETATKNQELLTAMLDTDPGARYLGEFGIGTNYGITRFTKNMLFDEKMGGTIHLAVGNGYPGSGSKNESGIHWDMLCDIKLPLNICLEPPYFGGERANLFTAHRPDVLRESTRRAQSFSCVFSANSAVSAVNILVAAGSRAMNDAEIMVDGELFYRVGLRQERQAGNLIMPNSAQHSIIRMV